MAKTIIKGDDLMLFDASGHSIAYAKNHTFTISAETADVTSKDHGIWKGNDVNKLSWEITTENLYTDDGYTTLFNAMVEREAITLFWNKKQELTGSVVDGDYSYWSKATTGGWTGKALITSLVANANTGENATFSATFTGAGKIDKVTGTV